MNQPLSLVIVPQPSLDLLSRVSRPSVGSAVFRHGFSRGSMMHAGLPVSGEWPKYVARFNVLYGFDPMQAHSNSLA